MPASLPIADWTEKLWQQQVVALARQLGWRSYHTLRSKGSQPGYPDLTLVKERVGVMFLELKTEKGQTTDRQRDWITALHRAGAEVYVVRPRQQQALARVLGARGTPFWHEARGELLLELDAHLIALATRQAVNEEAAA